MERSNQGREQTGMNEQELQEEATFWMAIRGKKGEILYDEHCCKETVSERKRSIIRKNLAILEHSHIS